MDLTSKQRAQLRGLANGIDTILQVGKDGIGENLIIQVDLGLSQGVDELGGREGAEVQSVCLHLLQNEFRQEKGKTFGQLSPEEKSAISHRGKALAAFVEKLGTYLKK